MNPTDCHASLGLGDAKRLIAEAIEPIADTERIRLDAALGRVLSNDLIAQVDVPAHDNAAMDGYALRGDASASVLDATNTRSLRLVGSAYAGRPYAGEVGHDECVRIMTGAMMPSDCDAVVPQEEALASGDRVDVPRGVPPGRHRRRAGEDLARAAVAIAHGRRITPSDLGLAASVGAATVSVVRRPRVAVFSTGTELREVSDSVSDVLEAGCIRDSNRHALIGMLARMGADVIDVGIVRDDRHALEATLEHACSEGIRADAIVTSGGVSAGDADYTRDVMQKIGRVAFWKLAIKPGRPMAFGRIEHAGRSAPLFGLPGNPVAMMVVFYALVREALLKLMGARVEALPCLTLICDTPLRKTEGRTEFVRGISFRAGDGWHVRPTGAQGSGMLRSMSEANCLIVLDHDRGDVAAGEMVEAWPFDGLI